MHEPPPFRIGQGFDVHRLVAGRRLVIGGVEIEHPFGLEGHSDADVLTHAIADALLGAIALGDIGQHFPNTDAAYKDADSLTLLRRVVELLGEVGWSVGNVDATLIAEAPKFAPHIPMMQQRLAKVLRIEAGAVGIKATTSETMGFTGRKEGIAAMAVGLIFKI